jgi:hypothetical protein
MWLLLIPLCVSAGIVPGAELPVAGVAEFVAGVVEFCAKTGVAPSMANAHAAPNK